MAKRRDPVGKNSKPGDLLKQLEQRLANNLLTVDDVAELLRTTPKQVRHMRERGQVLAPVKFAGLGLRWRAADFHQWLAAAGATC